MANLNAQKHTVILTDEWHGLTRPVTGYEMIGTIQRGKHIAALAERDGRYFSVENGLCEPLNQNQVLKAMRKAGYAV
jgi:hypothetical protein